MKAYRSVKRGFTLVEILIVVIILGILAAIVIPQFTNASTEARENSVRSQVQTLRSQVELYKLQHADAYPTANGAVSGAWAWDRLTGVTELDGTAPEAGDTTFGPYLQQTPVNQLRNASAMFYSAAEVVVGGASGGAATDGFVITPTGKLYGIAGDGTILD
jgi:general secretion pathway protein G